ncbi:hypothetical protein KVR01_009406 [Diaporthe batatas]|uniref:uncharacterized protein n=1 Tax=Diaporthe batatas TaxID=748121 RepID=UPI001D0449D0|nr:uncharacterized protein KVR01_009406 [Diaporthe batatas]KAG8161142.1 hypothetical protein KVR01_009406 [Diaporthe batatas]
MDDYDDSEVSKHPSKRLKSNDHDTGNPTRSRNLIEPVGNFASCRVYPLPTFEGLPPEIRLRIVESGLGLEDLRAAVRASPALYRQYRLADRRLMLRAALHTSLGPAIVDMWAAHKVAKIDLGTPDSPGTKTDSERIVTFMTKYIELRDSWPHGTFLEEQLRTDNLVEMSNWYLSVVKPLLDYFSRIFLSDLRRQLNKSVTTRSGSCEVLSNESSSTFGNEQSQPSDSWHAPYEDGEQVDGVTAQEKANIESTRKEYRQKPMTKSETVRLTRALYRVQLWCNIYGFGAFSSGMGPTRSPVDTLPWQMVCMFHETFEAWEVEEMLCIYQHMLIIVERLFKNTRKALFQYDEQHKGELRLFANGDARHSYKS